MACANRKRQFSRLAVLTALSAVLAAASGRTVVAGSNDDGVDQRLVGAWSVQVTLRNCDTNAPMGSFTSIVTFHRGGTLTESTGSVAFEPGQRTDGHGAWRRVGRITFSQHVIALLRFESADNLPGIPTSTRASRFRLDSHPAGRRSPIVSGSRAPTVSSRLERPSSSTRTGSRTVQGVRRPLADVSRSNTFLSTPRAALWKGIQCRSL